MGGLLETWDYRAQMPAMRAAKRVTQLNGGSRQQQAFVVVRSDEAKQAQSQMLRMLQLVQELVDEGKGSRWPTHPPDHRGVHWQPARHLL
jgi:hypothetical protein